jgi:methylenetetrahydrofolate dehydrogenase (NADP+)/methenyltetrahydrofolate cyclohydrolase
MIIDGKALAEKRRQEVWEERKNLAELSLGVVIATTDTVTASYVGIKKKAAASLDIAVTEYRLPETCSEDDIIAAIKKASIHNGIILQLPIPKGLDVDRVKNAIPHMLDVDVMSDASFAELKRCDFLATPPVPAAMRYVLKEYNVPVKGANVVIVGKGRLVGKPAEVMFNCMGAKTKVLQKGDDVAANTKDADIVVTGTGVSHLIKPDMVKEGVVIMDAGASELGGKLVGDVDPAVAEKASVFTPVPRGLGPIVVVEIFANLVALAKQYESSYASEV